MDVPDVRYARAGGVAIAYQVVGEGPSTLVFAPHLSELFTLWMSPLTRPFLDRLARDVRLVVFNPRGTGLSDRPRNVTLESRMDDIAAVLDAVGQTRANLLGVSTSANACALFAAAYPDRCERLVLVRAYPRGVGSHEHPRRWDEDRWLGFLGEARERWGERDFMEETLAAIDPAIASSAEVLDWQVWQSRLAASPASAAEWIRMGMETDISGVYPSIRAPTLVLYVDEERDEARTVCERVRDGQGLLIASSYDQRTADAIVDFVQGESVPQVPDSVLATVLFTDLVESTERAAALGDRAWRDVLMRHHADVRRDVARYRGEEVDSAGDGFFCRFDGPARAIACARAIVARAHTHDLAVRAGVHIGECEIVGDKLAGIAVVTGARLSALAAPGQVLVSQTVKDLVAGSGFAFEDCGEHVLKGVPGTWRLYAVADG